MPTEKPQQEKARLHPRNKNRERYDLGALVASNPELKAHVIPNKYGVESIDFSKLNAVKLLNKALLNHYYGIKNWEFPDENLCPPIPGRADYIHHMADLLGDGDFSAIPKGDEITCLDVGVGASCIYPILGVTEYGWSFIGSDVDAKSIASSQSIVDSNDALKGKVEFRLQSSPRNILQGIINVDDKIDVVMCNPPFHSSREEAEMGTRRKIKNLSGKKVKKPELNFAGISNELIFEGGEYEFIRIMINESKSFSKNCFWFSTIVSKQSNVKGIRGLLVKSGTVQIKTIPMGTGNKSSRIIAWTYLTNEEREEWKKEVVI